MKRSEIGSVLSDIGPGGDVAVYTTERGSRLRATFPVRSLRFAKWEYYTEKPWHYPTGYYALVAELDQVEDVRYFEMMPPGVGQISYGDGTMTVSLRLSAIDAVSTVDAALLQAWHAAQRSCDRSREGLAEAEAAVEAVEAATLLLEENGYDIVIPALKKEACTQGSILRRHQMDLERAQSRLDRIEAQLTEYNLPIPTLDELVAT